MRYLVWMLGLVLLPASSLHARAAASSVSGRVQQAPLEGLRLAQSKKKKGKKKPQKGGKKKATSTESQTSTPPATTTEPVPVLDLAAPPPAAEPAPVLDLSTVEDSEAARQQVLTGADDKADDKKKQEAAGAFDFGGGIEIGGAGGGEFDFGEVEFDLGTMEVSSAERDRFEKALSMMSDEDYATAALEFRFFLEDPKFGEFTQESQYQLAKSLYKMGFLDSSLERFRQILDQGPTHRRYRKSVEWLFFISRKMADETPVLAELARFRNVSFPKAYRNEYRYLLSKYLFVQANRLEVERIQQEELARSKKSKAATFDFGAVADAVKSGNVELDFSSMGADLGGSFDFGGAADSSGGLDFGGGGAAAPAGGDGFDFGGGGGLDFGGAAPAPPSPALTDGPVRQDAPTTAKEAIRQGVELIAQVEETSKFYPRAKYLEGLLHYLDGADQLAVNAFQEVVRVLNPRSGVHLDPKLREMAFLSLARVHYGHKQFDRSAYYYDQIDRDSESWLTALFEASWSYYQRGDFEKALGNLLTLHSPFFEREYFPESQLVKAIIYFEACRYPETRQIVDDFLERFTRVMQEIERIAQSQDAPERLYDRIAQLQAGGEGADDDVTQRVVSLALADPEIRTAREVLRQFEEQLALWKQMPDVLRTSRLGEDVREELQRRLTEHAKAAGEVTRKKFERELYALKSLLAQALRVKIEVARAEREAIEAKMRGEAAQDEIVAAVPRVVVDDEHLYWPYEGEYWRDELGTYELDFSMCRPLATR